MKTPMAKGYLAKQIGCDDVPLSVIDKIMDRLNNHPRKTLNGRAPNEVFFRGERTNCTYELNSQGVISQCF